MSGKSKGGAKGPVKAARRVAVKVKASGVPALSGEVLPPEGAAHGKAKGRARNPTGRSAPPHHPTEATRAMVEAMASYGIPREKIAALVGPSGITIPTLDKHYRRELDTARAKLSTQLTESLVAQALGHPAIYDDKGNLIRAEQKRYAPAAMWLLRREDYIEQKRLEDEARAQEAARQALRDRLKIAFEMADPEEIEVIERVFGRVREKIAAFHETRR